MKVNPFGFKPTDTLLDAEVAFAKLGEFQNRFLEATGVSVTPGNPPEFMSQRNKWGTECRIYFNSEEAVAWADTHDIRVEMDQPFRAVFKYRINNNDLWWELVRDYEARLGRNEESTNS